MWGQVGLIGLSTKHVPSLNAYRAVVESQTHRGSTFTLFPKEAVEKRGNVSVLLREIFRNFDVTYLPKAIMQRSRKLRGGLRVTHVKEYEDDEYSRSGACKAGWRIVLLQGCAEFMRSLELYDQEHKFPVGSGHVLIRGGGGRPKASGVGRGQGGDDQAAGRGSGRQQQQKSSKRPGGRFEKNDKSRRGDKSYDRDFPKNSTANESRAGGFSWESSRAAWGGKKNGAGRGK